MLEHVQRASGSEAIAEAREELETRPYAPDEFPFVVILKDDGKDQGGGWQVAHNASSFGVLVDDAIVYTWPCKMDVGMPLRTKKEGRISAKLAAEMTTTIANAVMYPLLASRVSWQGAGAVFCIKLTDGMNAMFLEKHPFVGARVQRR